MLPSRRGQYDGRDLRVTGDVSAAQHLSFASQGDTYGTLSQAYSNCPEIVGKTSEVCS
jgi:hypothetical protein